MKLRTATVLPSSQKDWLVSEQAHVISRKSLSTFSVDNFVYRVGVAA